jgi:hypothetical protein
MDDCVLADLDRMSASCLRYLRAMAGTAERLPRRAWVFGLYRKRLSEALGKGLDHGRRRRSVYRHAGGLPSAHPITPRQVRGG